MTDTSITGLADTGTEMGGLMKNVGPGVSEYVILFVVASSIIILLAFFFKALKNRIFKAT